MLEDQVYEIICKTEPITVKDYGTMISFADIADALIPLGLNKDSLESILRKLATNGKLTLVDMGDFDPNLIIGVRLV